jgi:hypothetical protein
VGDGVSYNDGTGCEICYVVGYNQSTRVQTINEGVTSMLVVELLKPAVGVGQPSLIINFQIDNSANHADVRVGGTPTPTGFVSTFRRQREFNIRGEADQIGQEGVETFSIPLSITSQVGLAAPVFAADPAMITVNDRSEVVVEITETDYQQREGLGNNIIRARVSYNRNLVNDITINFFPVTYDQYLNVFGELPPSFQEEGPEFDAQEDDFIGDVITVTLPRPGGGTNRQVDVLIPIVDDAIVEQQQTLIGYIEIASAVDIDNIRRERTATQLIINDNDEIIVGFTEETYTFSEGQSNTFITVAKDGGVVSERTDIAVNISLQGIPTATPGEDFEVIQLNTVVSIDPDDQEVNIPVSILEDLLPEGVESFTLTVARASDGFGFSADRTDTFATTEVFITDNDEVVVGLEMTAYTVSEDDGSVEVCARVTSPPDDQPLPREFVLRASTLGLTATQNVDFGEFNTTLPQFDDSNRRRCFTVTILEDQAYENDEEFQVSLSLASGSGVTIVPSLAVVQILDPDPLTIGLSQTEYTVMEGTPFVEVCAEVMNGVVERETIVSLDTADNTAEEPGDYVERMVLLTFVEGTSEACTNIQITNDTVLEDNESFLLSLTTTEPRVSLNPAQGSVLIIDDDTIMVGFQQPMYEVDENGVQVEVCAEIVNGEIADDVTVMLVTMDNTALAGSDYSALTITLTFDAPSTLACTNINIMDDESYEVDETFFGILISDNPMVQIIPAREQTIIQIVDEDSLTIGFTMTSINVTEGNTATICARVLEGDIARDVPIQFNTQPGTARAGSDYITRIQQLNFSASNVEICVDVDTVENNVVELTEQFRAILTNSANLRNLILQPNQTTVNIQDDDVQCPILINPPDGRVSVTGNSPGDTATYICDPDFELVGDSTRVCGDDG